MEYNGHRYSWNSSLSFGQMFALIAPHLIEHPNDGLVRSKLIHAVLKTQNKEPYGCDIEDQPFQTLKIQLQALGLVHLQYTSTIKGGMALFWSLTSKGEQVMTELRVVRKSG